MNRAYEEEGLEDDRYGRGGGGLPMRTPDDQNDQMDESRRSWEETALTVRVPISNNGSSPGAPDSDLDQDLDQDLGLGHPKDWHRDVFAQPVRPFDSFASSGSPAHSTPQSDFYKTWDAARGEAVRAKALLPKGNSVDRASTRPSASKLTDWRSMFSSFSPSARRASNSRRRDSLGDTKDASVAQPSSFFLPQFYRVGFTISIAIGQLRSEGALPRPP